MTEENRRQNIGLEVERGSQALQAARVLLEQGLLADAVSRAYYAMLHHARTLLLTEGLEARTHAGVAHLLHLHFVRTGRLDSSLARYLTQHQAEREEADYDSAVVFTADDARASVERAEAFCETVLARLREGGWRA